MKQDDEWDYGPFKVGDVVEICNCKKNNGVQVEIVAGLAVRESVQLGFVYAYVVSVVGMGACGLARQNEVRCRKPPMTGLQDVLAMFDKQPDRVKELA